MNDFDEINDDRRTIMTTRTSHRLFAQRSGLFRAALIAVTAAASCDADLVVGVLARGPHDGSGGSGGAYGTGSGGSSDGDAAVASGGAIGSGGIPGMVAGMPVRSVGGCAPLSPTVDGTNLCGRLFSVAFSPDGQTLAAGQESVTPNVHLWSLPDGELLRAVTGAGSVTYSVAFSPDGHLLATASSVGGDLTAVTPGIVNLWDVSTGALVRNIPATCGGYADSVAFSPDGSLLATAGFVGPVEIWKVTTGARVASIPSPTTVNNVHFSPDGSRLIVAGNDGRATFWTVPAATLLFTLEGIGDQDARQPKDAAYSPDGLTLASTGSTNLIKVWDASSHELQQSLYGHFDYVSHVLWIDDNHFVSDDWSGLVILWAKIDGAFGVSKAWQLAGQALGTAVSPDKSRLAVAGADGITFLAL